MLYFIVYLIIYVFCVLLFSIDVYILYSCDNILLWLLLISRRVVAVTINSYTIQYNTIQYNIKLITRHM